MKDYEFSQFNIQQVVNQIMGQIVAGVGEAIVKCFDKLSAEHSYNSDVQNENVHYYNGWKTNKAHYVNSKCIIPTWGCFARGYKPDKYGRYKDTLEGLDARGCFQVLDDLEKALDYLDKGETATVDLSRRLQHAANDGKTTVVCKYFTVTFYKKGTCHIKFHDQKIVDRLNIYVGRQRAWLPPTYGSVRYDQMDDESKRVVDEFQGREKYEAVMHAASLTNAKSLRFAGCLIKLSCPKIGASRKNFLALSPALMSQMCIAGLICGIKAYDHTDHILTTCCMRNKPVCARYAFTLILYHAQKKPVISPFPGYYGLLCWSR